MDVSTCSVVVFSIGESVDKLNVDVFLSVVSAEVAPDEACVG